MSAEKQAKLVIRMSAILAVAIVWALILLIVFAVVAVGRMVL